MTENEEVELKDLKETTPNRVRFRSNTHHVEIPSSDSLVTNSFAELNQSTVASNRSNLVLFEQGGSKSISTTNYLMRRMWEREASQEDCDSENMTDTDFEDDLVFDSVRSFRDLHKPPHYRITSFDTEKQNASASATSPSVKRTKMQLGLWSGVFIPCFSNIVGVIVFVRLPWIVGEAGIGHALIIGLMSMTCTFLTALSVCAISTNGRVSAGGPYYMISRSLGKEFGGSVGILFYIANVVGCVMYIIGVIEILTSYVAPSMSLGSSFTDNRVYGSVLLVLLAFIALFGIRIISKASLLFFTAVALALLSSIVGIFASNRPGLPSNILGFPGAFFENFSPGYLKPDSNGVVEKVSFFDLFGIFFPSVTGIMAGASRSGNLKEPSKSIPKGTLGAQISTSLIYLCFILFIGTVFTGDSLRTKIPTTGLLMASVSWPTPWITLVGCLFASLGAALQCLANAPRLLQAIAKDNIIPFLRPLNAVSSSSLRGLIPAGEPHRTLVVSVVLAEAFVLIGSLDSIASIVTMLYLITYLFLNVSTGLMGFLQRPDWRPSWRYYHWTVSALASILCLTYMFMINWITSLVSLSVMLFVYKYIEYRGAQVQWGDGVQALNLQVAQRNLLTLERQQNDSNVSSLAKIKSWRPQILTIVSIEKSIVQNPKIFTFMNSFSKGAGLFVVGNVVVADCLASGAPIKTENLEILREGIKNSSLNAFADSIVCPSWEQGVLSLAQSCGLGPLRPNTLLLKYPETESERATHTAFVQTISQVLQLDTSLLVVKGIDLFPSKREKQTGYIDVYWVVHDGGLLTLITHILLKHTLWKGCKMRVFAFAQMDDNSVAIKENLKQSLNQLRIDAECEVLELGEYDISDFAYEKTVKMRQRNEMLRRSSVKDNFLFRSASAKQIHYGQHLTVPNATTIPVDQHKVQMMNTSVKINSLIRAHSGQNSGCRLVITNLPSPQLLDDPSKSTEYVEYLNVLLDGLDRVLLVKGTGNEVITAYF